MTAFARSAAAHSSLGSLLSLGNAATRMRGKVDSFSTSSVEAVPSFLSYFSRAERPMCISRSAGYDGWRSMTSTSASPNQGRFVRDEKDKLVRNAVGGDDVDGDGRGRGGRGGGRVIGGRGGRGWKIGKTLKGTRQDIASKLIAASCAHEILSVVGEHLHELNQNHVSTAVNRLGKVANRWDFASPARDASVSQTAVNKGGAATFDELLRLVRHFAPDRFSARKVSNTINGIAKIMEAQRRRRSGALASAAAAAAATTTMTTTGDKEDAVAGALAALETATTRVAADMLPRELVNTMYSFASLDRSPGVETWAAMDAAAGAVAPQMNAQDVSTSMYAYARLGKEPSEQTQEALDAEAGAVAATMNEQDVSNLLWSYGTLGIVPSVASWAALDAAVAREAAAKRGNTTKMNAQNVSNLLWAYAKLRIMPGDDAWAALESATGQLARVMNAQNASNLLLACGTLGRAPAKETWNAVAVAVGRVAPDMTPQGLANTVWSLATLSTLRGVELPSSYGALWEAAGGFEARQFSEASLSMLFQVHLMHRFATGSDRHRTSKPPPSSFTTTTTAATITASSYAPPSWLMKEARGAWKKTTWDETTVSTSHRMLARVFSDLGVRHEVERVTDDGYFSMDIYLPDHDVCVEFDGPSHYYRPEYSSYSREPPSRDSVTRTAKTELRDFFLTEQCAKCVSVPYFEFDECKTAEQRRAYVKDILAKEAGVEP